MKNLAKIAKFLQTESIFPWVIIACFLFALLPPIYDLFLFWNQSQPDAIANFLKFMGGFVNALAISISVFGILPLSSELEKIERQIKSFTIPPLVVYADEDDELIDKIRGYFGKIEASTGYFHFTENLKMILESCESKNKEQLTRDIKTCLEQLTNVATTEDASQDFSMQILQERLKHSRVVVILYYKAPTFWFKQRLNLCRKLEILDKTIICTDKGGNELKAIQDELGANDRILSSKRLNLQKLASCIEKLTFPTEE